MFGGRRRAGHHGGGVGDFCGHRLLGRRIARPHLGRLERGTLRRFAAEFVRHDLVARRLLGGERIALHHVTVARPVGAALAVTVAPAVPAGAVVGVGIGGAVVAFFLGEQRLPVSNRDLIVVGMDFRERQKSVPVAAVIDEGRLQRRLYARDLGEIDVTAQLFAVGALEVEFLDAVAA